MHAVNEACHGMAWHYLPEECIEFVVDNPFRTGGPRASYVYEDTTSGGCAGLAGDILLSINRKNKRGR